MPWPGQSIPTHSNTPTPSQLPTPPDAGPVFTPSTPVAATPTDIAQTQTTPFEQPTQALPPEPVAISPLQPADNAPSLTPIDIPQSAPARNLSTLAQPDQLPLNLRAETPTLAPVTNYPTQALTDARRPAASQMVTSEITVPKWLMIGKWLLAVALVLVASVGFGLAVQFAIIDFPAFERQLNASTLDEDVLYQLALRAALFVSGTALSLFFAIQLAVFDRKSPRYVRTLLAGLALGVAIGMIQYATTIEITNFK